MKLPTLNPFRALSTWWRNRRPVKDAKAYGVEGAALREAIRNLTGDELAENRRAFAQRFAQFSNRQRDRWLKANGCPVQARPRPVLPAGPTGRRGRLVRSHPPRGMTVEPLLAVPVTDFSALRFPLLLSPKIDGVRGWNPDPVAPPGLGFCSRKLKAFPNANARALFDRDEFRGLDGELALGDIAAPGLLRATNALLQAHDRPADGLVWHVFDTLEGGASIPYEERLAILARRVPSLGPVVRMVDQHLVHDREELEFWEDHYLDAGLEGVIVRDPRAGYKFGRSTEREGILLKVKRFEDAEATIVGSFELEHNDNARTTDERGFAKRSSHQANKRAAGVLGGWVVRGLNGRFEGVEYRVGGGFTAKQRAEFWALRDEAVGHVVTVKYFARGVKDKPRHAQFKDFRPEFDR
jgi:DNA ligase-1